MEQHLGRKLKFSELVHHIDHNTKNNQIQNLTLTNRVEHKKKYHKEIGRETRWQK